MTRKKKINVEHENVHVAYSNWFGQLVGLIKAAFVFIIAGRGSAKSTDILAERIIDMCYEMPGAYVALSADTYMNAFKNIVPGIIDGLKNKGWIEGKHFVVGKRPPTHFKQPYKPVLNWSHTLTALTGTHFKIISQDRPSMGAGDSFQHHIGDEAKYLDERKKNNIDNAVRGQSVRFGHSPYYMGATFVTDMPDINNKEHDWIFRMEEKMNKEHIMKLIQTAFVVNDIQKELLAAQQAAEEAPADMSLKTRIKLIEKKLSRWEERFRKIRMDSTFFYIVSSFVNADILTERYFKNLLEKTPFKKVMTSILSLKPEINLEDRFYPKLGDHNFYSDGYNYTHLDKVSLSDDYQETSLDLKYIDHNQPLEAGFDSGNMCSLDCGQQLGRKNRALKFLYTLPSDFIPELGAMFREYFKYHRCKELNLYHDRATNKWKSVRDDHASKLKKAIEYYEDGTSTGWTVTLMNENQGNIDQQTEYELMLVLLTNAHPDLPEILIDKHNSKELKSSLEKAKKIEKIQGSTKTIHKNKTSEKLDWDRLPLESTNPSDAFKYRMCRPEFLEVIKGESSWGGSDPSSH